MSLRKLRIGLFIVLFIGMCILPVAAIKINDIDIVLQSDDYARTSDFYAQRYDILYIKLEVNGLIGIQVRESSGAKKISWNNMSGVIDLHYTIPNDASYYVYFENVGDIETLVVGTLYLNEDVTITTTTTTSTTSIVYINPDIALTFLTVVYGTAGALFVVSMFVYRKRKNPSFKFLTWFEDEELLPVGWQPSDEEET